MSSMVFVTLLWCRLLRYVRMCLMFVLISTLSMVLGCVSMSVMKSVLYGSWLT